MRLTNTGKIKGSAGGIARGILSKLESIERYEKDPKICLHCNNKIELNGRKPCEVKLKKFCTQSCSAKYYNALRTYPEKIKVEKEKYIKPMPILDNTKGYYKSKYDNWWTSRIPIAKTARLLYMRSDKPKECLVCGYNKHIEVCHVKAVSEYTDETTLREINQLDNLIALCRNHHWELDNNLIQI